MNTSILTLAMGAPTGGTGAGNGGGLTMFLPMILIFGIFYFMLIRPQQRKEKERKKMIDEIKSGDRVVFAGGLLGTVTNLKEQTLVIRIADNVKIEVARSSVLRLLDKGEKLEEDKA